MNITDEYLRNNAVYAERFSGPLPLPPARHVAVVACMDARLNIYSILGLAEGEAQYDDLEQQLAASPVIAVPTITLEGDANGAPHPEPSSYASKFSGKYAHRTIEGGVGHNLPQEAPEAFAKAIIDVDAFDRG